MTCDGGPGGNRASVGQGAPKTKARPQEMKDQNEGPEGHKRPN